MRVFHCDHCGHLLFFENTQCLQCERLVAYLPDLGLVGSLDQNDDDTWRSPLAAAEGRLYRLCRNYRDQRVCNWAIAAGDRALCDSCELTRVIPDLSREGATQSWYRLEVAKRRLLYTLFGLGLFPGGGDAGAALRFDFKSDEPGAQVLTGYASGVITINVVESDDAERERRRVSLNEPYRTLLGHMRHESGHYYWERLIRDTPFREPFRARFGDDTRDYAGALAAYHASGPPADWADAFISAYATAHPLEDWAETWAHYLHMVDTLETAGACGFSLSPRRGDEPSLPRVPAALTAQPSFDLLMDSWIPLTYALNNLTRGLGLPDAYPFVLSSPAVDKLRFVHDVVQQQGAAAAGDGP